MEIKAVSNDVSPVPIICGMCKLIVVIQQNASKRIFHSASRIMFLLFKKDIFQVQTTAIKVLFTILGQCIDEVNTAILNLSFFSRLWMLS